MDSTLGAVRILLFYLVIDTDQHSFSYIPIKVDYTDLFDVMAFFSGDLDGRNGHEDLAKAIAAQGKDYAAKHWRYQDMEACQFLFYNFHFRAWLIRSLTRFLPIIAGVG